MAAPRRTFDKFRWLKALRMDPRFTDRDVRLAMAICTDYTRGDGTGWAVELDALADAVPSGISRNRLKDTLQRLTECGYLVETARTIGGRGVTARRSHNLMKPAPPAGQVKDETCTASVAGKDETCTASGSNLHRQRLKPAPLAEPKNAPELPEIPPTGTSTGTSSGTAESSPWPDEPRCDRHQFTFNSPPCNDCKRIRLSEHRVASYDRAAIRNAIDRCPDCDEYGRRDDLSDCPLHPNQRRVS